MRREGKARRSCQVICAHRFTLQSSLPSDWPWSMVTRLTPYPHLVCPAGLLAWNSIFQFFPLSYYGLYCFLPPWIHFANIARDVTRNLTYSGVLSPLWFVACLLLSPALTMYMHTESLHSFSDYMSYVYLSARIIGGFWFFL